MSRFFGDDARPIAQIVTRRHPLALALYLVVFLLGCIFVFHWYGSNRTEAVLFPGVNPWAIFAWKWMMVTGGGGAVAALLAPARPSPHWPDLADLLHLEGIASIVAAFGLGIYLVVLTHLAGTFQQASLAIALYGVLILGHLWRGGQAVRDARRLERLAHAYTDVERG